MAVRDVVQAAAGIGGDKLYVEDVFSTYLYTGNGSTQTITNGIDLAGEGGLVWLKSRSNATNNWLYDTDRGNTVRLISNSTAAQGSTGSNGITSFNSDGFSLGAPFTEINGLDRTFASWTFRKQPKFFDCFTYTGTGSNRTISHNLGSVPGCVIIKRTDSTSNWNVWHTAGSDPANQQAGMIFLNTTGAYYSGDTYFLNPPTSTELSFQGATNNVNGATYVAYLFAHDAGGFGDDGEQNVVSCGSYTGTGASVNNVNLGYEPQFLLIKRASGGTSNWQLADTMRGMPNNTLGQLALVQPNQSGAENTGYNIAATAQGFEIASGQNYPDINYSGNTYIYIAIRRGPMKTPESGTEVFTPQIYTGDGTSNRALTGFGFSPDLVIQQLRTSNSYNSAVADRLRGVNNTGSTIGTPMLRTNTTEAEGYSGVTQCDIQLLNMDGITVGPNSFTWSNGSGYSNVLWNFRRAPGFFDEVCYPGTFSAKTVNHNLGVVPELIIFKKRNGVERWPVYSASLNANQSLTLSAEWAANNDDVSNNTRPTSTVFSVSGSNEPLVNEAGYNYVAYLFASCPGVSKVGSYTGTGTTQQINCGFTTGARFVLIKRTDDVGDWYVWDSARGIVSGNDPYLLWNTLGGEVTSTDYVDTYSAGFEISSTAPAAINASGGSFIYLAIA